MGSSKLFGSGYSVFRLLVVLEILIIGLEKVVITEKKVTKFSGNAT